MIRFILPGRIAAAALAIFFSCTARAESPASGKFSTDDLRSWEEKSFTGHTFYRIVRDAERGAPVLEANAQGSASGLFRKSRIDLTRTPVLNWTWKIERPYSGSDEKTKTGDDFPVRVYVVVEKGWLGLSTRAINYVWAGKEAVGSTWPNPFTAQAHMVAVDSGPALAGKWISHSRNVREDLRAAFGEDFTEAHAIAVMTDGDNGGREARAWYGDLYFSER